MTDPRLNGTGKTIRIGKDDITVIKDDGDDIVSMRLKAAEEKINLGFLEIGFALYQIKMEKLYEVRGYANFTQYLRGERKALGFSREHAERLVDVAMMARGLEHWYMPKKERHFRALGKFPVDMHNAIMKKATTFAEREDTRLTATHITSVGNLELALDRTAPELGGQQVELYDKLVNEQTHIRRLARMREDTEQVYSNVTMETILPLLAQATIVNGLFAMFGIEPTQIKVSAWMRITE